MRIRFLLQNCSLSRSFNDHEYFNSLRTTDRMMNYFVNINPFASIHKKVPLSKFAQDINFDMNKIQHDTDLYNSSLFTESKLQSHFINKIKISKCENVGIKKLINNL